MYQTRIYLRRRIGFGDTSVRKSTNIAERRATTILSVIEHGLVTTTTATDRNITLSNIRLRCHGYRTGGTVDFALLGF